MPWLRPNTIKKKKKTCNKPQEKRKKNTQGVFVFLGFIQTSSYWSISKTLTFSFTTHNVQSSQILLLRSLLQKWTHYSELISTSFFRYLDIFPDYYARGGEVVTTYKTFNPELVSNLVCLKRPLKKPTTGKIFPKSLL